MSHPLKASAAWLIAALAVSRAAADTILCKDGSSYTGIVAGETAEHVTIRVGAAKLHIPATAIRSVDRSTPEENRALEESWERLDARYKAESKEAERNAPPVAPPPRPTAEPEEPVEPVDVEEEPPAEFPEEPDFPPPPTPTLNPVQERLLKRREIREQIYRKNVVPGMTPREVRSAWGYPYLTHPVHGVYEHTDRWIYKRPQGRAAVYFKNGKVTSVNENVGILGF